MEIFFVVVPSVMIVGLLHTVWTVVSRSRRLVRAWGSGLTAEARCLRTYTTTSATRGDDYRLRTTLHHVYEFTTRDGATVRFEEASGPGTTLEGDVVTVFHPADHPDRATANPPARGRLFVKSGFLLAFLCVVIAFCVDFMITGHSVFAESAHLLP